MNASMHANIEHETVFFSAFLFIIPESEEWLNRRFMAHMCMCLQSY